MVEGETNGRRRKKEPFRKSFAKKQDMEPAGKAGGHKQKKEGTKIEGSTPPLKNIIENPVQEGKELSGKGGKSWGYAKRT